MNGRSARILVAMSAVIFAVELAALLLWISAFNSGATQAERVSNYLGRLPFGIGVIGTTPVTMNLAIFALLGTAIALSARSVGAYRRFAAFLAAGNGILAFWLLFTMM